MWQIGKSSNATLPTRNVAKTFMFIAIQGQNPAPENFLGAPGGEESFAPRAWIPKLFGKVAHKKVWRVQESFPRMAAGRGTFRKMTTFLDTGGGR